VEKLLTRALIAAIAFYRRSISPNLAPRCRFHPSCSAYGLEAIEKYGPYKGLWLTLKRLSRCRPGSGHGYDPLP